MTADLSRDLTTASPTPGGNATAASAPAIQPGVKLDHFEILGLLGAGGFGQVYKARDTRLERMVAVKVLPDVFARDAERRERLRREAVAASALNHPNICTVYDLVEASGHYLIVMELVEGRTLHRTLDDGPLPVAQALPIAIQIADALAEAHKAGILHRDIKSSNIALNARGQVKILDFGLAKLLGSAGGGREETNSPTLERLTAEGTTLGTLSYMSPEQLLAQPVDRRSDLFSVGVVMYEMLTRQLPFEGSSPIAVADAILHTEPRAFGEPAVPEPLRAIVRKLLQKDAGKRHPSAEELRAELKAFEASLAPKAAAKLSPAVRAAIVTAALVLLGAGGFLWHRGSRARWVLETAAPEVARLIEAEAFIKAVALLREARGVLPKDATLEKLWLKATDEVSFKTTPPGAEVSFRPYRDSNAWEKAGPTPLEKARLPNGLYLWRLEKPGFAPVTLLDGPRMEWTATLVPEAGVPRGMVPVLGGDVALLHPLRDAPRARLGDYLIDRTEVTSEEFKSFVDAGGYEKRELWKEPFFKDGRALSWEEAVPLFRDATGRPGPATWEAGSYPRGMGRHPVAGVSWYEAAAYAEFVGKSLPTVYHWSWAAQKYFATEILGGSNFRGAGSRPVGEPGAEGGFGTFDMAGNVKEWCWNEARDSKRFILGGGFGEDSYLFLISESQSPWERRANAGFRCMKLLSAAPPEATAKLVTSYRDFNKETPVSDEAFRAFSGLYAYDKEELHAKLEETETGPGWTRQKVSFDAAYGGERMAAHVFLPRTGTPPFQAVVHFPGMGAQTADKLDPADVTEPWGFLLQNGRAVVLPVLKSTFERRDGFTPSAPPAARRDHIVMWAKDLSRTLDYLETREDVDAKRVAYLGVSWGAQRGPLNVAVEPRFRAAILVAGGFMLQTNFPEVDALNFAPRVRIPVLMLNGRFDDRFPLEDSQRPLFRLLGTPEKDKRHVLLECGHFPSPWKDVIRETLDWLDKYLGPVKR